MEERDFKSLKDLTITDQLKKHVRGEIRDHFVDEWTKFCEPSVLADKLDEYERVIDTGVQISVVRTDVIEGQSVDSGGIMSAFGEREITELKIFHLKIDDSRHSPHVCNA
ncbi:hypothetical protein TNCV_4199881 [Trichonephila clavipes]|uniref:Uncharacterized protein n=1 Tax=Trichonephila clavipes TaxID=2585209 RepID=A0A8X6WBS7_TRICX|nr:hypothetical protein TNCV_4199881 [Trichonephila clavipes]